MYAFYASELSKQQMYKFLIGSVVPRPIALITSQSESLLNIAPFSFFNIVSSEPALLSVAVNRKEARDERHCAQYLNDERSSRTCRH